MFAYGMPPPLSRGHMVFSCPETRVLIPNSRACPLDGSPSIASRCPELWTLGDTFSGCLTMAAVTAEPSPGEGEGLGPQRSLEKAGF